MNTLKEYIQENLIITNKEAEKLGYTRRNLSELTKRGQIERLRPGLYQLKGKVIDDFVLISSNSNRIIFSHQTALYLHNLIPVYDIERTICDIIIDREKIDKQIFTEAIKRYFKSPNKNLRRLIKYSRLFNIEDEIRKYMEVLL